MKTEEFDTVWHGRPMHVIRLIPGREVICDLCSKDFTDSPEQGGILVQSKGICPDCAPRHLQLLRKYDEMNLLRGECPKGMSFADWIRSIR